MSKQYRIEDLEIEQHLGTTLPDHRVVELANLYATIFKMPPWCFDWQQYVADPDHPLSAVTFLRTLIEYGATLFIANCKTTSTTVGYLIVLRLSEPALVGILSDLRKYGNAQPGDVYLAGFGVIPAAQGIGLGKRFMHCGLEYGNGDRFWLRTRKEAVGMVKLSEEVAGMRIHETYPALQAGKSYERRLYVRDAS